MGLLFGNRLDKIRLVIFVKLDVLRRHVRLWVEFEGTGWHFFFYPFSNDLNRVGDDLLTMFMLLFMSWKLS